MSKLVLDNLAKFISQPLKKRIDQKAVEKWTSTLWKLPRGIPEQKPASLSDQPFVIMFPPPNITGTLHLGHALTAAIQDALIRSKRMQGYHCLFIPGFDHAGLATQSVVEKMLWKQQKMTRQQFGRQNFLALANQWKENKLTAMKEQLDRLGLELNHEREYFTMDDSSSLAVQTAFKKLFDRGIIYRSTKPIFWSEEFQTTLSDIEVEIVDGVHRYIRTGEIVFRRPVSQWFIKAEEIAKAAVETVKNGSIDMVPSNYKNSWYSWLVTNGVEDWCISRQSWWGHRIPAYRLTSSSDHKTSSWVVANDSEQAKLFLKCKDENELVRDPDVLDTWFSSSLLPLTVSGWPDDEKFASSLAQGTFPLHIMETGFDILTFWVSKMVMMSLALTGTIPFKQVLLHGMICDSEGKKMSKSRGNVIDPLDVIDGATLEELQKRTVVLNDQGLLEDEKLESVLENQKRLFPRGVPLCGADGLRAYLLSHDVLEEVVRIQMSQIDKVRRLSNKIWNIFRFVMSLKESDAANSSMKKLKISELEIQSFDHSQLDEADRKVLDALKICIRVWREVFDETYQFHYCFTQLESFWVVNLSHDYIEAVKGTLLDKNADPFERSRKFELLSLVLLTSIKLMHPFMPHLTEFLFQKIKYDEGTGWILHDGVQVFYNDLLSYQPSPTCD